MPTPGAPTTAILTSEREDFLRLACLMALIPLLELMMVTPGALDVSVSV